MFYEEQFMSLKNKLPALRKLYSIYEEIPEDFLDETDIDSYFLLSSKHFNCRRSTFTCEQKLQ